MLDIKLTIIKLLAEAAVKDQNQYNYHDISLCARFCVEKLILYFLNTDI